MVSTNHKPSTRIRDLGKVMKAEVSMRKSDQESKKDYHLNIETFLTFMSKLSASFKYIPEIIENYPYHQRNFMNILYRD